MKEKLSSIEEFDISTEMPEYEINSNKILDLIEMFRNMLDEQQACIELMRRYLNIVEHILNK